MAEHLDGSYPKIRVVHYPGGQTTPITIRRPDEGQVIGESRCEVCGGIQELRVFSVSKTESLRRLWGSLCVFFFFAFIILLTAVGDTRGWWLAGCIGGMVVCVIGMPVFFQIWEDEDGVRLHKKTGHRLHLPTSGGGRASWPPADHLY